LGSFLALIWVLLVFWLTYRVVRNWNGRKFELLAVLLAIMLFSASPTVMLAVERGTLDILVTAFAAVGLIGFASSNSLRQVGSAALLFAAVILKYFAIGIFVPFFAPKKWSLVATLGTAGTAIFMLLNLENLRMASEIAGTGGLSTSRLSFSNTTGLVTILVSDPLAITAPEEQGLSGFSLRVLSLLLFSLLTLALILLLRRLIISVIISVPRVSWLLIVGGSFALWIPYMIGSSYDYRMIILALPFFGFLFWVKATHFKTVRVLLWIMTGLSLCSVLTGASMSMNEYGFIVPKFLVVFGDASLAIVLAFGVALFINAWLPSKKVSA